MGIFCNAQEAIFPKYTKKTQKCTAYGMDGTRSDSSDRLAEAVENGGGQQKEDAAE